MPPACAPSSVSKRQSLSIPYQGSFSHRRPFVAAPGQFLLGVQQLQPGGQPLLAGSDS
jgi:hypothetical protein